MSFKNLPIGKKAPELVNVVIEISKGSRNKYEYDEELDVIKLDRVLHSPVFYPTDYGFIPETRSEDGDHLDVLVISSESIFSGCVVEARPIGAINMEDEAGQDEKIIAVADKDPLMKKIQSIDDLNEHFLKEIQHFFEVYKHLENKQVKVKGWMNKEEAFGLIKAAVKREQK